jgi:pSer/pThr/pTyr-binding forkhead associated (FHA) protein
MPKMIVSIDGVVIKEVQLIKERTTLGRRPYNDIVIDNLAVSGEHAVLQLLGGNEVYLEDLNSTNGSYINGKAVKKQLLQNDDIVEIGKYRIKFIDDASFGYEKVIPTKSNGMAALSVDQLFTAPIEESQQVPSVDNASIKVISGVATGREVALVKVVTTIGKPGIAIAAITKRTYGFVIAHVEGVSRPTINGVVLGDEAVTLSDGDVIELAGTKMQFLFT